MMAEFEELTGGNSNQVRKHGNTVIRQCGKWSPFVHQLLKFLEAEGFKEAPAFIQSDGKTETLSFIEGDAGNYPLKAEMLSDDIVIEAGQLLRRFHDHTENFAIPENTHFMLPVQIDTTHEVICHNDFAPYNCVFKEGHIVGIIDFDTVAPGLRIRDIAYAVYRFAPLVTDNHCLGMGWQSPPDRASRLQRFCNAYGLEDRTPLIDTVIQRLEELIKFMRDTSSNLEHITVYIEDIAYIQINRKVFENAIR